MKQQALERRVTILTRTVIGLTLALSVVILSSVVPATIDLYTAIDARVVTADTLHADVVVTERLSVVEPNGQLALLAANSARMPGLIIDGDTLTTRGGAAGLLFFFDGVEVGGLIYRINEDRDPPSALGHLSLDQYHHDQVVLMQYDGRGSHQRAGVYVNDLSPAFNSHDYKAFLDSVATLPERERNAALNSFKHRADSGEFGGRRVALESNDRIAALRLSDYFARERLRAVVDSAGAARIEFLDAEGKVVRTISAQE